MDREKECKDCRSILPISEFYGVQGECKTCTKKRVRAREDAKKEDPKWVVAERKRHRIKSRKAREMGTAAPLLARKSLPPEKIAIYSKLSKAIKSGRVKKTPCIVCGSVKSQAHHEDYSKPLDVTWLCVRHHADRHIHLRDCETLGKSPLSVKAKSQYTQDTINK
jgi:hypothetical protein